MPGMVARRLKPSMALRLLVHSQCDHQFLFPELRRAWPSKLPHRPQQTGQDMLHIALRAKVDSQQSGNIHPGAVELGTAGQMNVALRSDERKHLFRLTI